LYRQEDVLCRFRTEEEGKGLSTQKKGRIRSPLSKKGENLKFI